MPTRRGSKQTSSAGVVIERASLADVQGILALARENGPDRGGELSVRLQREAIVARISELPSIVARRQGSVIGFLLTSEAKAPCPPIVAAMLRAYPGSEGAYVYGPVCVHAAKRRQGIAAAMFAKLRRLLPGREGILFIKASNEPSLRAHRKMGMRQVAEFTHEGIALVVFSYNS